MFLYTFSIFLAELHLTLVLREIDHIHLTASVRELRYLLCLYWTLARKIGGKSTSMGCISCCLRSTTYEVKIRTMRIKYHYRYQDSRQGLFCSITPRLLLTHIKFRSIQLWCSTSPALSGRIAVEKTSTVSDTLMKHSVVFANYRIPLPLCWINKAPWRANVSLKKCSTLICFVHYSGQQGAQSAFLVKCSLLTNNPGWTFCCFVNLQFIPFPLLVEVSTKLASNLCLGKERQEAKHRSKDRWRPGQSKTLPVWVTILPKPPRPEMWWSLKMSDWNSSKHLKHDYQKHRSGYNPVLQSATGSQKNLFVDKKSLHLFFVSSFDERSIFLTNYSCFGKIMVCMIARWAPRVSWWNKHVLQKSGKCIALTIA